MFVSIFCAMKIRHMRQLFCFEDKKFEILNLPYVRFNFLRHGRFDICVSFFVLKIKNLRY